MSRSPASGHHEGLKVARLAALSVSFLLPCLLGDHADAARTIPLRDDAPDRAPEEIKARRIISGLNKHLTADRWELEPAS